jgi:hypothetical protein
MKILSTLLVLLFSSQMLAHDYKVVRFEASDYQTFSTEELLDLVGDSRGLLPNYVCNGRDEMDPFHPPLRMNPLRNSLRIKSSTNEIFTYILGDYFNEEGHKVTSFSDPFVQSVVAALARFEKVEPTYKMLRFLEESFFPITISVGRNSFNPHLEGEKNFSGIFMAQAVAFFTSLRMSAGLTFSDIGVGGQVHWNPRLTVTTIEADGERRKLDNDVALAHEMYHAFDSIRGLLDLGMISGEGYEFLGILEFRAVYFENMVRQELGIQFRKFYGTPATPEAPGVLDAHGQPIYIPATCLAP